MLIAFAKTAGTIALVLLTLAAELPTTRPVREADDVAVMTFNIRNSNAQDGPNAWEFRQPLVLKTVREFDPDLLGTQEVRPNQLAFLSEQLQEEFHVIPGQTGDGTETGERVAVFARKSRFEPIENGQFWLSETPDQPGSRGWDAALPRTILWVRLRDLHRPDHTVLFLNTHFDHRGPDARWQSAGLVRRWLDQHAGKSDVILVGDFNAPQDADVYDTLLTRREGGVALVDAYRQVKRASGDDEVGTFHGFRGVPGQHRIDWILASPTLSAVASDNDLRHDERLYPSDHFPVFAILRPGRQP